MGYKGLIPTKWKPALCGKRIYRSNIEKCRGSSYPSHENEESGSEEEHHSTPR